MAGEPNKQEPIVVGLDIGTTKIAAIVAQRDQYGKLKVLGLGKAPSLASRAATLAPFVPVWQKLTTAMGLRTRVKMVAATAKMEWPKRRGKSGLI